MDNSGLLYMLKEDKFGEIKLMYSLFRRCTPALAELKLELKNYIISEGLKFVSNDTLSNEDLVKYIIEFRDKMIDLHQKSLARDSTIELTIMYGFENFINKNEKTAKSLVMYLDE